MQNGWRQAGGQPGTAKPSLRDKCCPQSCHPPCSRTRRRVPPAVPQQAAGGASRQRCWSCKWPHHALVISAPAHTCLDGPLASQHAGVVQLQMRGCTHGVRIGQAHQNGPWVPSTYDLAGAQSAMALDQHLRLTQLVLARCPILTPCVQPHLYTGALGRRSRGPGGPALLCLWPATTHPA